MRHQYVSIDRIFTKLGRDLTNNIPERDVVEWTGEALEFIGAVKSYEECIAFLEVKNYQCNVPKNLHAIIQIARDNSFTGEDSCRITPKKVVSSLSSEGAKLVKGIDPFACEPNEPVWLDEHGTPIVDYDLAYYRPYFDFKTRFLQFSNTTFYRSRYTPIRLKTSTLFNSLVCREKNVNYGGCKDEYTVIAKSKIRFSFRDGAVVLPYLKQVMDEVTGYPMVPDNISHTTAITKYITMKKFEREFYAGRQGAEAKMKDAEQKWDWYCGQASNNDKMIQGIDEHQNLLDQRSYLLPDHNKYYGFFGSLNEPEGGVRGNGSLHGNIGAGQRTREDDSATFNYYDDLTGSFWDGVEW